MGDESQTYIKAPAGENYIDQLKTIQEEATVSPICGYMFDDSDFQTQSSVIYSTIQEYLPRLQNGMCESEEDTLALVDEFVERLETAGSTRSSRQTRNSWTLIWLLSKANLIWPFKYIDRRKNGTEKRLLYD